MASSNRSGAEEPRLLGGLCERDRDTLGMVFQTFFTTKLGQGTGLGLPVSIDIVRAHGGEMAAESTPGQGTTFRVRLPAAAPPPARFAPESTPVPESGQGERILVVEDNPVVATLCEEVIRIAGYTPVTVGAGKKAVSLAHEAAQKGAPFSLCLVDIGLPDIDGLEVAARLGDLPVLLMSGNPPEAYVDRLARLSRRPGFVGKPFDFDELVAAIQAALEDWNVRPGRT